MSESDRPQDPWASVPNQGAYPGPVGPQQGYGYQAPMPYYYAPLARRTNGLSIAALVCGICGFIYLVPAILGVIFGIVSLNQIKRDGTEGKGMAIAGIVTGASWLALVVVIIVLIAASNNS